MKPSIFSLLLEKPNYNNPRNFLYHFKHTKFVIILKCNRVPCRIFRGISFYNVVMTCARCGKFVICMLHFLRFQRYMHSICVWNMKNKANPLKQHMIRHIYTIDIILEHMYMCSFLVWKKRVFELSRVWPWRLPCGDTPFMVLIGPVFKACLKRVGNGGYGWVEKEMYWFAEDMS